MIESFSEQGEILHRNVWQPREGAQRRRNLFFIEPVGATQHPFERNRRVY